MVTFDGCLLSGLFFAQPFGKEPPARFLIHRYHSGWLECDIFKKGPSVRFSYQIPDIAGLANQDELENCYISNRNIFVGVRQRPHKGIKDGMEKTSLFESRLIDRIANLLLMNPSLGIFSCDIKPDGSRI